MTLRRRPISINDHVEHIDGRVGLVMEIGETADGLPAATIKWHDGQLESLPLGYLIKKPSFLGGL